MDSVSAAYGWSDEYILDLSLARLRQIVEAIGRRASEDRRERLLTVQWQTRHLAMFIAQTADVDLEKHGGKNPLLEAARTLTLVREEPDETDRMRGPVTGYVSDKEGRQIMTSKAPKTPKTKPSSPDAPSPRRDIDNLQVDEEGNVIGVDVGSPADLTTEEFGQQAVAGSFEALLNMANARR